MVTEVRVGLVGFGTVGVGVARCILENGDLIGRRTGVRPVLQRVADLDITSDRGLQLPEGVLTRDVDSVLTGADIDVVVELIGGTTAARDFILRALRNGKPVVTANKALLAEHGAEIFATAEEAGADVYYEASVAGGIPIVKALREGLVANRIRQIAGILNGTCNYILTRMEREHADFDVVLRDAQQHGYAEADPSLDVDGLDTAHKAAILASLAYGEWFGLDRMHVEGIRNITLQDVMYAGLLGYRIKLLAVIRQDDSVVQMRVHPALVPADSLIGSVSGVYNAVWVYGEPVGATMYYGRGAGREATSSAVVADIVDVGRNLKFGSHRRVPAFRPHEGFRRVAAMSEVRTRYYLRLQVADQPGVLAAVAGILGERRISIASVTQHEADHPTVPLVILTHEALEAHMTDAIARIAALDVVHEPPMLIRIEDLGAPETGAG